MLTMMTSTEASLGRSLRKVSCVHGISSVVRQRRRSGARSIQPYTPRKHIIRSRNARYAATDNVAQKPFKIPRKVQSSPILPPCLLFVGFHPDEVRALQTHFADTHPAWNVASIRPSDLSRPVRALLQDCAAGKGPWVEVAEDAVQGIGCMVLCSGEVSDSLYDLQILLEGNEETPSPLFGVLTDSMMDNTLAQRLEGIRTDFQQVNSLFIPVKLPDGKVSEAEVAQLQTLQPVLHAQLDAAKVPSTSGGTRADASCVAVLDGLMDDMDRQQLLEWLVGQPLGKKARVQEQQLAARWEQMCFDYDGAPPTWGLQAQYLAQLQAAPPAAALKLQAKLAALYPEYRIGYMPGAGMASEYDPVEQCTKATLSAFVANAVMAGQHCAWHRDMDPSLLPITCPWVQQHGLYYNREPGKPLFVSCLVYLDAEWPDEWHAETLFGDPDSGVGLMVKPKGGRVVLMDQDVPHRIVAPSAGANQTPRFSLVWKLVFWPRHDYSAVLGGTCSPQQMTISRPHWRLPLHIGLPTSDEIAQ